MKLDRRKLNEEMWVYIQGLGAIYTMEEETDKEQLLMNEQLLSNEQVQTRNQKVSTHQKKPVLKLHFKLKENKLFLDEDFEGG